MLTALYRDITIYLFVPYARRTATVSSNIDLALDYGEQKLTHLDIQMAKNIIEALNIVNIINMDKVINRLTLLKKVTPLQLISLIRITSELIPIKVLFRLNISF